MRRLIVALASCFFTAGFVFSGIEQIDSKELLSKLNELRIEKLNKPSCPYNKAYAIFGDFNSEDDLTDKYACLMQFITIPENMPKEQLLRYKIDTLNPLRDKDKIEKKELERLEEIILSGETETLTETAILKKWCTSIINELAGILSYAQKIILEELRR